MKWGILFVALAITVNCKPSGLNSPDYGWAGSYEFDENIPGDMPRGWMLEIASGKLAEFRIEGRQTAFYAKCRIEFEPQQMSVYLYKIETPDIHFKLNKGDLLFTIKRKNDKIETVWKKIRPFYSVGNFVKNNRSASPAHGK